MAYPKAEVKAGHLSLIVFLLFFVVFLNLFRLQVLKGEYYRNLSEKNCLRVVYLEPPRGKILDRQGRVMATSRLSFNCSVISREAKNTIRETFRVISPILKKDPEDLESELKKNKAGVFSSMVIARDIAWAQAMAIEEMLDTLPGIIIETRPQREYPYGESAAHVIGYTGPMTDEEKEALEDQEYRSSDWPGREGIERSYESYLRGSGGGVQMEVNSRGRFLRALGVREPREGRDVELTVDAELQKHVQGLIAGKRASVIVMELGEGGILSMNSSPSFNPNLFASSAGRKEVGKYIKGAHSPMINRGLRGQYPLGSVFKVVTALAALESGKIKPGASFRCPGYLLVGGKRFGCWSSAGHGAQNLIEAFAHSCDVYFYLTGLSAGSDSIYAKAVEFGFSQKTGIDLPEEKKGQVPSREWKKNKWRQSWYDGDTANLAIGQGYLLTTPLQALGMMAAVANDGDRLVPHLIEKIGGVKVWERHGTRVRITPEYLKAVKRGLEAVIDMDTGTGRLARCPGVRVAGKTGTAQSGQDEDHAWFSGYAPADKPKVALVVFVENGGHGGVVAAGIAHEILKYLKESRYL